MDGVAYEEGMKTSSDRFDISVVLPTRNRASILGDALLSLAGQTLPPDRFEVIVVNNGSADNTTEVVNSYIDRFHDLVRMVNEPLVGLNNARNAGVRASKARIIVFFDDDARAGPQWLESLLPCFEDPEVGAAGGSIELKWECERPPWWEKDLDHTMGRLFHGDRHKRLTYPELLWGMNLAVRRPLFSSIGLFRSDLDRMGEKLIAGGDVEICLRIWKAGLQIAYEPRAAIVHLVTAERANMKYIRRQAYWHGRSARLVEHFAGWPREKSLATMPFMFIKSLGGYALKHRFSETRQRELIYYLGYFLEGIKCMLRPPSVGQPPSL
jgi:glycosyltransferase involved in cell wall biosynthesis